MALRIEEAPGAAPLNKGWYELWSGNVRVGILRLQDDAWRPAFWFCDITLFHEKVTGVSTGGGARTFEECCEIARSCWATNLAALGLKDA